MSAEEARVFLCTASSAIHNHSHLEVEKGQTFLESLAFANHQASKPELGQDISWCRGTVIISTIAGKR